MPTQIVNYGHNETVSEIALKCGDKLFKDFGKDIYAQAVYRAQRGIAIDYKILERIWNHTVTTDEAVAETEIVISPLNFDREIRFMVKHPDEDTYTTYEKVNTEVSTDDDATEYYVRYASNQYVFNYSNKEEGDIVAIHYVSGIAGLEDYEETDSDGNNNIIPVIPDKYYEEILRRGIIWIAQLGIAQFQAEKKEKYSDIYKLYYKIGKDQNLVRDSQWITVKPFTLI